MGTVFDNHEPATPSLSWIYTVRRLSEAPFLFGEGAAELALQLLTIMDLPDMNNPERFECIPRRKKYAGKQRC